MKSARILLVGGGTAGHLSPLVAVAEALYLAQPKNEYLYVGSAQDIESPILAQAALPLQKYSIVSGKLHRFFTFDQLRQGKKVVQGFWQAEQVLKELRPDLIFAKGGAVSVPIVWAAARRGIPVLTHETDVVVGLANRLIARYAKTIFTAYPVQFYHQLEAKKLLYIGQPVRQVFYQALPEEIILAERILPRHKPILTIIGGSQGALVLNKLIATGWESLLSTVTLVHITGSFEYEKLKKEAEKLPKALQKHLFLVPFVDELAPVFQASTVIVSRAGGTIAELAAVRAASILLPLSTAAQNHQWANARVLQEAKAVQVLDERKLTSLGLVKRIDALLKDPAEQARLREAIATFDHPEAAKQMAEKILSNLS